MQQQNQMYNQMQNQQNAMQFFEYVKNNFLASRDVYVKKLQELKDSPINDDSKKYVDSYLDDIETFKMLGNFAYIGGNYYELISTKVLGLKFPDNKSMILKSLSERFFEVKIENNDFNLFLDALYNLSKLTMDKEMAKYVIDALDEKMKVLANKVKTNCNPSLELIDLFRKLFNESGLIVDVNISQAMHTLKEKIINDKNLTYHDIILINSVIFQNGTFVDEGDVKLVTSIITDQEFKDLLDIAYEYFELQKYALLYFDGILNFVEKLSVIDSSTHVHIDNLDNKDATFNCAEKHNNKTNEKAVEDKKEINKILPIKQTDEVHSYIYKTINNIGVNVTEEKTDFSSLLMLAINRIYHSEHLNEFSQTLSGGIQNPLNRRDNLLWKKQLVNDCLTKVELELKNLNTKFDNKIKSYISEIDEKVLTNLIDNLNGLISSKLILNSEASPEIKGMLIEQLAENKIFTIKQLNQFMEVVEGCKIRITNVADYVEFSNYIEENNKIKENLKSGVEAKQIQDKQTFYVLVSKYLKSVLNYKNKNNIKH